MNKVIDGLTAIVREAGAMLQKMQGKTMNMATKEPGQLVTEADMRSHALIADRLSSRFPGIAMLLEEQREQELNPDECFVCDELDGTIPFSRGLPDWGISVAHMQRGEPVNGVIYLPTHDVLVTASKDCGCLLNGTPARFTTSPALSELVWITEIHPYLADQHHEMIKLLARETLTTRVLACSVATFAELLQQRAGLYVNFGGGKIWDFAAGALALTQAGGICLTANGQSLDWEQIDMSFLGACSSSSAQAAVRAMTPWQAEN